MKKVLMLTTLLLAATANADLILTGTIDGYNSTPKGIELYVDGYMDLTGYTIEIEANGGDPLSWYNGVTFGTDIANPIFEDQFIYITSTYDNMIATFASATASNTFADGSFNMNGNDAYRVKDSLGNIIDQLGDPSEIASSSDNSADWCYLDSYAYRVSGTGPDGGFTIGNWYFAGNDYLDTHPNTDTPFGTYQVPEPMTLALLGLGGLLICRRK